MSQFTCPSCSGYDQNCIYCNGTGIVGPLTYQKYLNSLARSKNEERALDAALRALEKSTGVSYNEPNK